MTVTEHAKRLGASDPQWAEFSSALPVASYRYRSMGRACGDALYVGDQLHRAFSKYADRQRVDQPFFEICRKIEEALAEQGVCEVASEVNIRSADLAGRVDLHGKTHLGRPVVVELKATLGEYALQPRASEVVQLVTYAELLNLQDPLLLCIRVSFDASVLNVFKIEIPENLRSTGTLRRN